MAETNNNQYALVTGATSGIGYELAKLFARDGYNLVIVARSEDELNSKQQEFSSTYGIKVVPIAKDLFEPTAAEELYQEVKNQGITVNVLVNDAGQGQYGHFIDSDLQRLIQIIQLNVISFTALTHLFLKDMVARNEGKILQLASIASQTPGPWQAVYHATKAYVLSLTEAIITEIKDTNVTMTALQPGATDTDFFNKADMLDSKILQDPSKLSDPAEVARDGYEALMKGDDKIISGFKNKVQTTMAGLMPESMASSQMEKQQRPVSGSDKDK